MRPADAQTFSNISASTAPFTLAGGLYGVDCVASFGGGSVKLQKLAQDATTYNSVSSGTDFTTAGYATAQIPTGSYRLTITTATGVYVALCRIPSE